MAKAQEAVSTGLNERHLQVVASFEMPAMDVAHQVSLHLVAGAQDNHAGQAAAFAL